MVEEQLNKKPKKGGDKNAVAILKDMRQLGSSRQKGTKVLGPIRRVRFTRTVLRQSNIRDGPSLNKI